MNESTVEALLRPTVEKSVALACYGCAALVYFEPMVFMLNEAVSYGMASAFVAFGYYRYRQGAVVSRYKKNLRRLPSYNLKSSEVPVSRTKIWLGKGFEWTATHTQRLSDLRKPYGRQFLNMGMTYEMLRNLERKYEDSPRVLSFLSPLSSQHFLEPLTSRRADDNIIIGAINFLSSKALVNPWRPLPPVGGEKAIHAVEPEESEQEIDLDTRTGHTLIEGTTRVGKSRLLEVLITQAIHRKNKQGDYEGPVVCLDPKGDAELMARLYTEAKRAGRKMYIMHLGFPDMSCRYNAIAGSFSRYTEIASRATDSMGGGGDGEAFKAFAWRFANVVAMAQVALGNRPTFESIQRYMLDIEPLFINYIELYLDKHDKPSWRDVVDENEDTIKPQHIPRHLASRRVRTVVLIQYLQEKRVNDPIVRGLLSSVQYEKSYYDKITASFLPLLEKLTTGRMIELIAPDYDDLEDKLNDYKSEINNKQTLLFQQSKMAAMGEMIGNIAHQWRQPLSTITTASSGMVLQKQLDALSDDFFYEASNKINASAQYLSKTIDDFRNFFSPNKVKSNFLLKNTFSTALDLIQAQFKTKNISIVKHIENVEIISYENELIQALINILNNARDELLKIDDDNRFIFIDVYKKDENVNICVRDSAGGIPSDILNRVFEPYFTTKHKAQGTGIGLYMTEEIIVKHLEGELFVKNVDFVYQDKSLRGAEFKIVLPIEGDLI